MFVDCIMFNNELSMLRARLEYLKNVVGLTLLVETNITISGKPKPYVFKEHQQEFSGFNIQRLECVYTGGKDFTFKGDKIDNTHPAWWVEFGQRNKLMEGIINLHPDDRVIIGDVDEVPSLNALWRTRNLDHPVTLELERYLYGLKWRDPTPDPKTVIVPRSFIQQMSVEWYRQTRYKFEKIPNGGWHFSWFMTPEQIVEKLQSFSHQEYNRDPYTNLDHIRNCIVDGKDVIFPIDFVESNTYIPPVFRHFFGSLNQELLTKV